MVGRRHQHAASTSAYLALSSALWYPSSSLFTVWLFAGLEYVAVLGECCPSGRDSSLNLLTLDFVSGAASRSLVDVAFNVLDLSVQQATEFEDIVTTTSPDDEMTSNGNITRTTKYEDHQKEEMISGNTTKRS